MRREQIGERQRRHEMAGRREGVMENVKAKGKRRGP